MTFIPAQEIIARYFEEFDTWGAFDPDRASVEILLALENAGWEVSIPLAVGVIPRPTDHCPTTKPLKFTWFMHGLASGALVIVISVLVWLALQ